MKALKALRSYLAKLIKGREAALATGMGITEETLKQLAAVKDGHTPLSLPQAVKLANLTATDPKVILNLQLDVQLEEAGVAPYKAPAKVTKSVKPAIASTGKGSAIMPARRIPRGSVVR